MSYSELAAALEMLDLHLTRREIKHVLIQYDTNKDLTLSIEEFQNIALDFGVNVGGIAIEHFKARLVGILSVCWFLLYTLYFYFFDSKSFVDAMWMCISTFTTTGLGDVVPSENQKWVAMFLTFVGLGFTSLGVDAAVTWVRKTEERRARMLDEQEHDVVEENMRRYAHAPGAGGEAVQGSKFFRRIKEKRANMNATVQELHKLQDHQLQDLGIHRGQIEEVARGIIGFHRTVRDGKGSAASAGSSNETQGKDPSTKEKEEKEEEEEEEKKEYEEKVNKHHARMWSKIELGKLGVGSVRGGAKASLFSSQ